MTDNNGNLKKQEIFIPGSNSWLQQYDYDSLNRLQRVHEYTGNTQLDWQQEYVYDRYGNRTIHQTNTWGAGINKKDFTVSTANNRLGVPGGQTGVMTYDNAGNLTNDTYTGADGGKETLSMLKGFLISLVIIVLTGAATTYPQTQAELNLDACKKFKRADEELNRTYKQILTIYSGESEFIQKFRRAQRAWIAFRDLHLESIYPKTNRGEYGSVNPMCRCQLLTSLTIERTKVLKEWLNGEEEGDVCAGSIKSTSELHRLRKDTPR